MLALKGNQETLHQAVIDYIDQQFENDFAGRGDAPVRDDGEGARPGRGPQLLSRCRCRATWPRPRRWKGLQTIGVVVSRRACGTARKRSERRYYISSLAVGVKRFARAVRGHWGIENSCHWSLDFTFREDESRIREKNLRENFAWLNRFLLSLLKQHPGRDSIVMRRRACGWDEDFMLEVLTGTTP